MQDYWETYVRQIEGHRALVSFNASVSDYVPDPEYGYAAFVKLSLKSPSEEGLVSSDEEQTLSSIEDRIEMESLRYRSGKYIGRIITQGEVNFIYYLKMDFEWKDTADAAMKHFDSYTYEAGSRVDSEWEVYERLLFPTPQEWQIIQNHHACDQLKEAGDNLRMTRAIEHKMFFADVESRSLFAASIIEDGFSVQREMVPTDEIALYGLQFYRIDSPYYYDIDVLTLAIIENGARFGGQYDGWETSLVKL